MESPVRSALYAELLSNIRQITLALSLDSPSDDSTQVAVTADGHHVQLSHHGQTYTLKLPARTALGGILLPVKQRGVAALSWRLPLHPTDSSTAPPENLVAQWSATDLKTGSGVACRRCGATVVPPDVVKVWKDLPSENWAEMMEFWHCHKPDVEGHQHHEPHTHDHTATDGAGHHASGKADESSLAARGYGASSAISAQGGVGFVDLTTLLLAEADCQGIKVSHARRDFSFVTPSSCVECSLWVYQEGGQADLGSLSGVITDTNTQNQSKLFPALAGRWIANKPLPKGWWFGSFWRTAISLPISPGHSESNVP